MCRPNALGGLIPLLEGWYYLTSFFGAFGCSLQLVVAQVSCELQPSSRKEEVNMAGCGSAQLDDLALEQKRRAQRENSIVHIVDCGLDPDIERGYSITG